MFKQVLFWLLVSLLITKIACDSSSGRDETKESVSKDSGDSKPETKDLEDKKEKSKEIISCDGGEEEPEPTTEAPTTTEAVTPDGLCTMLCTSSSGSSTEGTTSAAETTTDVSASTDMPAECPCKLVKAFKKILKKLTVSQKTICLKLIKEIEIELVKTDITFISKMTKIQIKLEKLKKMGADGEKVFKECKKAKIGAWGYGVDIKNVIISFGTEIVDSVISKDESGNVKLFTAIRKASSGDAAMTTKTEQLIVEIDSIISSTTIDEKTRKIQIFEKFESFKSSCSCADFEEKLYSEEISGFGSIGIFVETVKMSKKSSTVNLVLDGGSLSNAIVVGLKKASKDTSCTKEEREKIKLMFDIVQNEFVKTTDTQERMKFFSYIHYLFCKDMEGLRPILAEIELGEWGTIDELIFCTTELLPEFDEAPSCSAADMDPLITNANANDTDLVQSYFEAYEGMGKQYFFHELTFQLPMWINFRSVYLYGNISKTIASTASSSEKHKKIGAAIKTYKAQYSNTTWFDCIPVKNYGFMAQYQKCGDPTATANCPIPFSCISVRNKVVEERNKDATTNVTNFITSFEAAMETYSQEKKDKIKPFFENMKGVCSDKVKKPNHKVGNLVKIIQDLVAANPTYKDVYDVHIVGFGQLKKFVECQGIKVKS